MKHAIIPSHPPLTTHLLTYATAIPFPSSTNPPTVSHEVCAICHEPLLVPSIDDEQPSYLIDDVEFPCKHHFHWGCILEYSISSSDARNRCAFCRQSVLNSEGEFIVQVRNEGGFVGGFDFGDEIDRHLFYKACFVVYLVCSVFPSLHSLCTGES